MPKIIPVLDKKLPFGEVYGGGHGEPRYYQNGHAFAADGTYLSTDGAAPDTSEEVPAEKQVDTVSAIADEDEIKALLEDPRAEELLNLDRELIVSMVEQAGGPVIGGEGSQRMMAAWLIKHTGQ